MGEWTSEPQIALDALRELSGGDDGALEGENLSTNRDLWPEMPKGQGTVLIPAETRAVNGRFLKGCKGGGRPKGSRSKLKDAVLSAVLEHYNTNGRKVLENLALIDPGTYMRIILQLLPPDNSPRDDYGDLTKEEVDEILAGIYRARQVRELVNFVEGP